MVHTGFVAKVQSEGKQRLTKHGNLPEGFSICPVHTGMNPTKYIFVADRDNIPRKHGDEKDVGETYIKLDGFALIKRGRS